MTKRRRRGVAPAAGAGAKARKGERSEPGRAAAETPAAEWRARPGRRTTEERMQAVLALLSGKATVDQLAARHGVLPSTIDRVDQVESSSTARMKSSVTRTEWLAFW